MISVSVIIPSYKRVDQTVKTIEILLDSATLGTDSNIEIIVADSSPDDQLKNTLQTKFANKIIYTRPEKPGISTNKNQGAKIAHYPILVFCDSDMEVEKDTIKNTLNALKTYSTAAAVGGQVLWRGGPQDGQNDRPRPEDRIETRSGTPYIEAIYSRYMATYRQVFWEVGGYDEKVFNMRGEGSDLSVRFWRAGYPLAYDSTIIAHHVHDAPDSAALRIDHPEWAIAKDLFLLAYKYGIDDDKYHNFIHTVASNFNIFKDEGYWRIIQGLVKNYDFIASVKGTVDEDKNKYKPLYDFKFLEIFSDKINFAKCITGSNERLKMIRQGANL